MHEVGKRNNDGAKISQNRVSNVIARLRSGFMSNYCMHRAAIIASLPTFCNYCSALHAIIAHETAALIRTRATMFHL